MVGDVTRPTKHWIFPPSAQPSWVFGDPKPAEGDVVYFWQAGAPQGLQGWGTISSVRVIEHVGAGDDEEAATEPWPVDYYECHVTVTPRVSFEKALALPAIEKEVWPRLEQREPFELKSSILELVTQAVNVGDLRVVTL